MLEKTLKSPLDSMEIKLVNPKGNQPWIFTGKIDVEAETPILCPLQYFMKSWVIGKYPDARKDWGQKEKGSVEGERLDSTTSSMDMNLSKLSEIVKDRGAWHAAVHGVTKLDAT